MRFCFIRARKAGLYTSRSKTTVKRWGPRIGDQFLRGGLSRHVPFEARDDLLLQDLQEPGIDGLTHHEEGLAIHRRHPIVGGGP